MSLRFEFATAGRIIFGSGLIVQAGAEAATLGAHPLVVTGRGSERATPLLEALKSSGLTFEILTTQGEPDIAAVQSGARFARDRGCDTVIGYGGGSVIDASKAIAAMATSPGDIHDHLEVIGKGLPLRVQPLAILAIPTTAGAGAEVTRNAVLRSAGFQVKVSLRSPWLLPRVAIVDPQLTLGLPPDLTASTGLDALTQLIEPYVSIRSNPMADALCLQGMACAARSLRTAFLDGRQMAAREDMALASLLGGMALANAGLGAVHGFAAPLGGMFDAPHGSVCAALLPHVMRANLDALEGDASLPGLRDRFDAIARVLTGRKDAQAEDGLAWIMDTCRLLEVPSLSRWGVTSGTLAALADKAAVASSMKGNPVTFSKAELVGILERALG
jgi:alcohol dehydrogenase class IV